MITFLTSLLLFTVFLYRGIQIIPQQEVWVVERLGKFLRLIESGPNWIIPFVDRVAYRHSLKEEAIHVPEQTAVTQDNVSVILDGFVYVRIEDPFLASYGVKSPLQALIQLVQTSMRSEIGKIALDKTFEERESLNAQIVEVINTAASSWGICCLRYEIKDIKMPEDIRKAMELQMTAERQKRARILESEGVRQSEINESEGKKQAAINLAEATKERIVLESEAAGIAKVNKAKGDAEAIELVSLATAKGIEQVALSLEGNGGEAAASFQIAKEYVHAFSQLAKEGNTILLPSNLDRPSAMMAEALSIYTGMQKKKPLENLMKSD